MASRACSISNFIYTQCLFERSRFKSIQLNSNLLSKRTRYTFRIFFLGGVASLVPWGWRDSYGKTEILAGWVTKICLKMYKKAGVGREGDI